METKTGTPKKTGTPNRRRPRGGGDLAGLAVALLMAGRAIGPVLRTVGPVVRQPAVILLLGLAIPIALVVRLRRRREARAMTEAMAARARARMANRVVVDTDSMPAEQGGQASFKPSGRARA